MRGRASLSRMAADTGRIREFWNEQAETHGVHPRATTPDYWMRELEIRQISERLAGVRPDARVLDIGCGNGYSLMALAERHPEMEFVGGDYAPAMIRQAETALAERQALAGRVRFEVKDVLDLEADSGFDVVITDRCLINLTSFDDQRRALAQIAGALRPGGLYVAVENFVESQDALNREREQLGLDPIPIRWHNLYLYEEEFLAACSELFDVSETAPISSTYYLLTRCVYSKLCQIAGDEPGYDDPIYEIATQLPILGDFGPIKLVAMVRR